MNIENEEHIESNEKEECVYAVKAWTTQENEAGRLVEQAIVLIGTEKVRDLVTEFDRIRQREPEWLPENVMIRFKGLKTRFRCGCGTNVFRTNSDHTKFRCNGCGAIYIGE